MLVLPEKSYPTCGARAEPNSSEILVTRECENCWLGYKSLSDRTCVRPPLHISHCDTNEKISNGVKGLVVLQRGEYSCDFVDNKWVNKGELKCKYGKACNNYHFINYCSTVQPNFLLTLCHALAPDTFHNAFQDSTGKRGEQLPKKYFSLLNAAVNI